MEQQGGMPHPQGIMQSKVVYLDLGSCVEVKQSEVILEDVAKIYAKDKSLEKEANQTVLYQCEADGEKKVISSLYIIKLLTQRFPEVCVFSVGENEVLLKYVPEQEKKRPVWKFVKTAFVCILSFFGSAFSIMAFHNDIGIRKFFQGIYYEFSGLQSDGFTVLELAYSIGLAVGILIFFNHFGKKKFTDDPTPIQVEMKAYEKDINMALVEISDRKGESL